MDDSTNKDEETGEQVKNGRTPTSEDNSHQSSAREATENVGIINSLLNSPRQPFVPGTVTFCLLNIYSAY